MNAITLPPDLERFADEAIAAGRYRDMGEVVRAGFDLLRQREAERERLRESILAAEAQGERDGFLSIDDVMRDADVLIAEMAAARR